MDFSQPSPVPGVRSIRDIGNLELGRTSTKSCLNELTLGKSRTCQLSTSLYDYMYLVAHKTWNICVLFGSSSRSFRNDIASIIAVKCSRVKHCVQVFTMMTSLHQVSDTQVRTPKKPSGFFGVHPPKKRTPKNLHFYFNLILVYTLCATNNAIFYCF